MNWLHVTRTKQLIALTIVVIAVGLLILREFPPTSTLSYGNLHGDFQMGFYDLMSQHKEIYNINLKTIRGVLMANITSPDDNRFVLKGKFTPIKKKLGRVYFNLTPIFYASQKNGLMIDTLVGQLMYTNYWMEQVSFNNQLMIVGRNGTIFLYPMPQ